LPPCSLGLLFSGFLSTGIRLRLRFSVLLFLLSALLTGSSILPNILGPLNLGALVSMCSGFSSTLGAGLGAGAGFSAMGAAFCGSAFFLGASTLGFSALGSAAFLAAFLGLVLWLISSK